ncbi:hypothetical protein Fmac_031849 [Flemingia macrophylla]|uniref:Nuclear nucleic acid-binding protein C1D n=1 Tax=Flemingia macrophylla TaxID=520843 RepID=A0ABD1L3N0_9FABA
MEGVEVPVSVIDTLNSTLMSVQQLDTELSQFLSLCDPDFLAQLPLLERAHSLFSLAKLSSTLFSFLIFRDGCCVACLKLLPFVCSSPQDKINVLQKKLERFSRLSEAQKQDDLGKISGGEGSDMNYQECAGQKRKYPFSEEQLDQIDAMESLNKEKEELLGDNNGNVKSAIVIDISDDDDEILAP